MTCPHLHRQHGLGFVTFPVWLVFLATVQLPLLERSWGEKVMASVRTDEDTATVALCSYFKHFYTTARQESHLLTKGRWQKNMLQRTFGRKKNTLRSWRKLQDGQLYNCYVYNSPNIVTMVTSHLRTMSSKGRGSGYETNRARLPHAGNEKHYQKSRSLKPVSQLRFKSRISRI